MLVTRNISRIPKRDILLEVDTLFSPEIEKEEPVAKFLSDSGALDSRDVFRGWNSRGLEDALYESRQEPDFPTKTFARTPVTKRAVSTSRIHYLSKANEKEIEEIVKEKWRYLVMQFGGVFLTELRPNKCFVENKRLADLLVNYDAKTKKYSLDLNLLGNYLKQNSNGAVQIHFSDIMFNPRVNDYDLFSITSGNLNKSNIYLDLARFLQEYNKGKETVIPVHLPYFEQFKTPLEVKTFGELSEDGKRDAVMKAEKVLRYLQKNWTSENVKLALETGNGESRRNGLISYALIYEPHHLKFLMQGRENLVTICEDVGHINLIDGVDWKDYLAEHVSEFHISGNNGKEDQHTIATPATLKDYLGIMSFLKFYSGNVCAEIGRGELSLDEFISGVKTLATELFSQPSDSDFKNLESLSKYLRINGLQLNEKNINPSYSKYTTRKPYDGL